MVLRCGGRPLPDLLAAAWLDRSRMRFPLVSLYHTAPRARRAARHVSVRGVHSDPVHNSHDLIQKHQRVHRLRPGRRAHCDLLPAGLHVRIFLDIFTGR